MDAIYMEATVAMTGQGGWPMSVFLTPAAEPFFCGTYFPTEPRPGWRRSGRCWSRSPRRGRPSVSRSTRSGSRVVEQLERAQPARPGACRSRRRRSQLLKVDFDPVDAGFGRRRSSRRRWCSTSCCATTAGPAPRTRWRWSPQTCERMARGGMYDQLAGGFARYCVDGQWVVPHFEKMLYDNALLLDVYTHWWAISGEPARAADRRARPPTSCSPSSGRPKAGSPPRSTPTPKAKRASTTSGRPTNSVKLLGDDADWVIDLCDVTGTFEHGTSVLQLRQDPDDVDRWTSRVRTTARAGAEQSTYPGRDDKVVAAWNGLAITALARAGRCTRQAASTSRRRRTRPDWSATSIWTRRGSAPDVAGRRAWGRAARRTRGLCGVRSGCLTLLGVDRRRRVVSDSRRPCWTGCSSSSLPMAPIYDTAADAEAAGLAAAGRDRQREPVRRSLWPPRRFDHARLA